MNAPAQDPTVAIVVPQLLVSLISQLTERMARVTGETPEDTRRAVELSVLTRGCKVVQEEIAEAEKQAERMGWPR